MDLKRAFSKWTVLALSMAFMFTWIPFLSGAEEPKNAWLSAPAGESAQKDPLIQKLHEAREAGDMEAMRKIEAMLPRPPAGEECSGDVIVVPSTTYGGPGDPSLALGGGLKSGELDGAKEATFGADVHVRSSNGDSWEFNQTMVSDSKGRMYVAWEDDVFAKNYIQIYSSSDGGKTWSAYGYVMNSGADLTRPSLAVGEGAQDVLLLAYIMDDGSSIPVPEVATAPLGSPSFTIHSVPVWGFWESYQRPVINTDSIHFNGWIAYLTCEGVYDSSVDNVNICHWRSVDGGVTWIDQQAVFGGSDAFYWTDPDETYGTTQKRVILTTFNYSDSTLYTVTSDDWGFSWNVPVAVYTMSEIPMFYVNPEIAAAVNEDNVMLCCTRSYNGNDCVGYAYSKNTGNNWTNLYYMSGHQDYYYEFYPFLTANEGGGDWHLAFHKNEHVMYTQRPQDLGTIWTTPVVVDDMGMSFLFYPVKGITSDWSTNQACIAWLDYRDDPATISDCDTYADFPGSLGLGTDMFEIIAADGGDINFALNAGPSHAGQAYLLLGSVTGMEPGIPLPGGYATLPLNWDPFLNLVIGLINTPVFQNFYGTLNGSGRATARFTVSPFALLGYVDIYFAFATMNPWDFASNAVMVRVE